MIFERAMTYSLYSHIPSTSGWSQNVLPPCSNFYWEPETPAVGHDDMFSNQTEASHTLKEPTAKGGRLPKVAPNMDWLSKVTPNQDSLGPILRSIPKFLLGAAQGILSSFRCSKRPLQRSLGTPMRNRPLVLRVGPRMAPHGLKY